MKKVALPVAILVALVALVVAPSLTGAAEDKGSACVACHTGDAKLSTVMAGYAKAVDAKLLEKLQGAMPAGAKLKGKHMPVGSMMKSIPDGCAKCHSATSKNAPALGPMLHLIHLTGEGNKFTADSKNSCASCHSFDAATGMQSVASGPEN